MTINFTCAGCGSLLKIKDQLAGTDGKCPKCKTEFVIPEAEPDEDSAEILVAPAAPPEPKSRRKADSAESPAASSESSEIAESGSKLDKAVASKRETEKGVAAAMEKSKPSPKSKRAASDEFDPTDFLMGDAPAAVKEKPHRPAPIPEELSDPEIPAPRRPVDDDRPRKHAGKSSAAMKITSGSEVGISASAHAKEMMMKAMEESRLHAGDPPPEEKKESFDFAGLFREFGIKIGGGIVACLGVFFLMNYLMSDPLRLPKLGYVTGEVKLDGAPLAGATVYFAPLDATMPGTKRDRARTSYGITDEKGHYKMMYLQSTPGVAVGKCRVWLDLVGPKGQVIPPDYTEAVMQVRDVKTGSQEFPFNMTSSR